MVFVMFNKANISVELNRKDAKVFVSIWSMCIENYYYGLVTVHFTHILHGCYTGTGATIQLPLCQWNNPEGYGLMDHMNPQRICHITNKTKSKLHLYLIRFNVHRMNCQRISIQLCQLCRHMTAIGLIHKSHDAPIPYPTMHHSEQKCAHFSSE